MNRLESVNFKPYDLQEVVMKLENMEYKLINKNMYWKSSEENEI
jgi:hypothetical protein